MRNPHIIETILTNDGSCEEDRAGMRISLGSVLKVASRFDLSEGACLDPRHTQDEDGQTITPTLWDGREGKFEDDTDRWEKAVELCAACPVLAECREYLAACRRQRISVDGVVAGIVPDERGISQLMGRCRSCGIGLITRRDEELGVGVGLNVRRVGGRGLCSACYQAEYRSGRVSGGARLRSRGVT